MQLWPFRGSRSSGNQQPAPGRLQELLVVCHGGDAQSQLILDNICTALDFAKIRFSILDLQRQSAWPALDGYSSIILCTELIWQLEHEKTKLLEAHIHDGGGVVVAYRCWNEHLSGLFGANADAAGPGMHLTTGLCFEREVFPGATGLEIDDSDWFFQHSRFDIGRDDLSPDCSILVSDLEGRPILWSRDIGKGRLAYWNTGILFCRALRGFLVQSVLDCMQTGVGAIAGFAMFHVDDFPTSLSQVRLEPVASEFPELDWDGFFFGAWHEDMMALRARHGLRYTWYSVMNYDDIDNGPDADLQAPATMAGPEILQRRFDHIRRFADDDEYGFHGYNHDPITTESWPDLPTLRSKLSLARTLWKDTVPTPLPTSWVPANNWYHADHVRVLKQAFPEISVVCGLFSSGEAEMGEYREFGPEPWEPALLCLPRETYGYVLRPELKMMMISQIACMGVWTHFVHPDDIYDIPAASRDPAFLRNPKSRGWRVSDDGQAGLLDELDAWISQVRNAFPWLEFFTTSQAESRYRSHVNNHVDVHASSETIEIRCRSEGLFYVKTRKGTVLAAGAGGEIVDSRPLEHGLLYIVHCSAGGGIFYTQDD